MTIAERLLPLPSFYIRPIRDISGRLAGCLEIHDVTELDSPQASRQGDPVANHCELVAISKGFAYNDWWEDSMLEWGLVERCQTGEKYEWYNVLWVEW